MGVDLLTDFKAVFGSFLPPIVLKAVRKFWHVQASPAGPSFWFTGDYNSWEAAQNDSSGYIAGEILLKVKQAALKVQSGDATFERDGVTFSEPEYSYPLISALLDVACRQGGLRVLDFGGALGGVLRQNFNYLSSVPGLRWGVVEQEKFVNCGRKLFTDNILSFHASVDECIADINPNVVLLSGVLQYLENPYKWIGQFDRPGITGVIVDRTLVWSELPTRLVVQHVSPDIYKASYPAWIFNEQELHRHIQDISRLDDEFDRNADPLSRMEGLDIYCKGYFYRA